MASFITRRCFWRGMSGRKPRWFCSEQETSTLRWAIARAGHSQAMGVKRPLAPRGDVNLFSPRSCRLSRAILERLRGKADGKSHNRPLDVCGMREPVELIGSRVAAAVLSRFGALAGCSSHMCNNLCVPPICLASLRQPILALCQIR